LVGVTDQPGAWEAVIAALNYHSSHASGSVESPVPTGTIVEATYYYMPSQPGFQRGAISQFGGSHPPNVPQFRSLDAPDLNEKVTTGPSYLFWTGGSVRLDDMFVKRVVFIDALVVYRSGPLELEDVSFIQCTFDVDQGAQGREFAKAFLLSSSSSTTVKIG
jgi:hypothetical protein